MTLSPADLRSAPARDDGESNVPGLRMFIDHDVSFDEFQLATISTILRNVGGEGIPVDQWVNKHGIRQAIDGECRREQDPACLPDDPQADR